MTKKRTLLSLVIFIIMLLTLSGCVFGGTNESKQESKKSNEYTASDIKYVSDADSEIAVVAGRSYTKTNNGMAAVALAYINGYTGPILVGQTANSISYIFYYSGKNVVSQYGSVTIDDEEWYYSKNIGFMSGNYLSFSSKGSIYCSKKTTAEDVAKEIIPMLDKTKFSANKIMTVEDLKALNDSSDSYVLGADIDLSTENNWQPIEGFKGVLNGGGYKINNLTISAANEENLGLFKTLEGTVRNLTIENASITARGNAGKVGIVAGTNKGNIKNVIVDGSINTPYYDNVGGLVGVSEYGIIEQCKNMAMVTGANNVGGIVGSAYIDNGENFSENSNEREIIGKIGVGGIAGYVKSNVTDATYNLTNLQNNETINGTSNVGGIFGEIFGVYTSNYYSKDWYVYFVLTTLSNSGEIVGKEDCVGGLVGKGTRIKEILASTNSANISGGNYVGGLVGNAPDCNIKTVCIANENIIKGKGYVGGFAGYAGVIENAENNGQIISTSVIIEDNVSKAYVGGIAGACSGLIDCKNNSDISITTNARYVGGLAGCVTSTKTESIKNNVNNGKITGADYVGGIVGYVYNATGDVNYNENQGEISGKGYVGGIFGGVNGKCNISTLTNYGKVSGTENCVGGLIGKATNVQLITVCANYADVNGGYYVGGYVGDAVDCNIKVTGETNENTITGSAYVGGFAGYVGIVENAVNNGQIICTSTIIENNVSKAYVGGIAGFCTGALNCINNSDINVSSGENVGGIAGYVSVTQFDVLNNNENYGKISGENKVGGIAGGVGTINLHKRATFTIKSNENHGKISGENKVGGIFGEVLGRYDSNAYQHHYLYFEITHCKNSSEIIFTSFGGGIIGSFNQYVVTSDSVMDTNTTDYGDKLGS